MKHAFAAVLGLALAAAAAPSAMGQSGRIDSYIARLGQMDHYNGNGQRLTSAAAIIRQDRANIHLYGSRDSEDQMDRFFASRANRARLEAMLANGSATPGARATIVRGQPLVRVDVWPDYVNVTILD
jgi:hypothetical protein